MKFRIIQRVKKNLGKYSVNSIDSHNVRYQSNKSVC